MKPVNGSSSAVMAPILDELATVCVAPLPYPVRMGTRFDFSTIRPLGSYAAKRCPMRIQLDVLQPGEPAAAAADVQLRIDRGIAFEDDVTVELRTLAGPEWVFVDESALEPAAAREATAQAMTAKVPVIVGANLQADSAGKRSGKPDLLVWHEDGYIPIDIKHHMTLDAVDRGPAAAISDLSNPTPAAARPDSVWQTRRHHGDAMQLAHYRRMLEAAGQAATEQWAGIIGKERRVVWYRLDEPMWTTPAKSDGKKRKKRTTLEVYDFEFDFRRDISAVAHRHISDPEVPLLVEPVSCSECPICPWVEFCNSALTAGNGDASLLPGVGYRQWRALRDIGVTDRAAVAALDLPTAELVAGGVDVARWVDDCAVVDPDTPLMEVRPRARKQLETLAGAQLTTAGELAGSAHSPTAALGPWAASAIISARAAMGAAPVYRRPHGSTDVPRGDIEIDIDMENTNDGVYQWGVFVTDRSGTGLAAPGYRAFVSWEPITPGVEVAVFVEFWRWLDEIRTKARLADRTVRAYCWYENAENTQMRRISAESTELAAAVQHFIASDEWIDMQKVFNAGWVTGGSTGLKKVAPLAGFDWDVADPGGGVSMLYHALATEAEPPERESARRWLLDYNRGDVEATLAVREWLAGPAQAVPLVR